MNVFLSLVVLLVGVTGQSKAINNGFPTQVYKSTHTAWIIPGTWEASPKLNMTATDVANWEGSHADASFGGASAANASFAKLGYMYNQMLDLSGGERAMWIRNQTGEEHYEELFLHYREDTAYNLTTGNPSHGSKSLIDGIPLLKGYTAGETHSGFVLYQTPPWKKSVWSGYAGGGALFIYSMEKFSGLDIVLDASSASSANASSSWFSFRVEYISECKGEGVSVYTGKTFPYVSKWSPVKISQDGTKNMTKSGTVHFDVPNDWMKCSTADGSAKTYGGGQYFGNTNVRDGYGLWTVKVVLEVHNSTAPLPIVNNVTIPWFIRYSYSQEKDGPVLGHSRLYRTIPGWNPANDVDGDGWVNDTEFSNRPYPNASARFHYESRAIPLGKMWAISSSWCRTNVWSNLTKEMMGRWLRYEWAKNGLAGAYNDDLLKLVGPAEYLLEKNTSSISKPLSGQVWEYNSNSDAGDNEQAGGEDASAVPRMDSEEIVQPYREGFAQLLIKAAEITDSDWIIGNISQMNLFQSTLTMIFFWALDAVLREDYITPWMGMTGWSGIFRFWDTFVYSAYGKKSLIQVLLREGAAKKVAGTEHYWLEDIYSGSLIYFLINVPNHTAYQAWGNGFNYGSRNTVAPNNWYESGIPMNIAYQRPGILNADIGVPDLSWTPEYPIPYHLKVKGISDYYVCMNSTSSWVKTEYLADGLNISMIPSNIYYAWMGKWNRVVKIPEDAILARKYTKGLILFRTTMFGHDKNSFTSSSPVLVPLNDTYRQVHKDGSRGPVVTELNVTMFSGAIMELVPPPLTTTTTTMMTTTADSTTTQSQVQSTTLTTATSTSATSVPTQTDTAVATTTTTAVATTITSTTIETITSLTTDTVSTTIALYPSTSSLTTNTATSEISSTATTLSAQMTTTETPTTTSTGTPTATSTDTPISTDMSTTEEIQTSTRVQKETSTTPIPTMTTISLTTAIPPIPSTTSTTDTAAVSSSLVSTTAVAATTTVEATTEVSSPVATPDATTTVVDPSAVTTTAIPVATTTTHEAGTPTTVMETSETGNPTQTHHHHDSSAASTTAEGETPTGESASASDETAGSLSGGSGARTTRRSAAAQDDDSISTVVAIAVPLAIAATLVLVVAVAFVIRKIRNSPSGGRKGRNSHYHREFQEMEMDEGLVRMCSGPGLSTPTTPETSNGRFHHQGNSRVDVDL